jgi:hypothetical protein
VFEMTAPIQSPAKCELRPVIRFLNAKGERPAEIHKHILAVARAQRFSLVSSPKETSGLEKFDNDNEVQEEVMTCFRGQAADFYDSGIHKLVARLNKCLDNAGNYVEN